MKLSSTNLVLLVVMLLLVVLAYSARLIVERVITKTDEKTALRAIVIIKIAAMVLAILIMLRIFEVF